MAPSQIDKTLDFSISDLATQFTAGEMSPVEVTEYLLTRIAVLDKKINSFITILRDRALAQAQESESRIHNGLRRGPLDGIPVALKDNIDLAGVPTTCASNVLTDYIAARDSKAVGRLKQAGAIILGKTNCDEFAFHATGEESVYGAVHNPWNLEHIAGGSSGGSAAAVAAGLAIAAVGTDTGGSVRLPAAFCGVVGLKPTKGAISTDGIWPVSQTMDHVGIFGRSVSDTALVAQIMSKSEIGRPDQWTGTAPIGGLPNRPLRIGVPTIEAWQGTSSEVEAAFRNALTMLVSMGVETVTVQLPDPDRARSAVGKISRKEAWEFHRREFGQRDVRYLPETDKALEEGRQVTQEDYARALDTQKVIGDAYELLFDEIDFIVLPTVPITAPRLQTWRAGATLVRHTAPLNLIGAPAISVPCGWGSEGLPIGIQFIGRGGNDSELLQVAHAYEQFASRQRRATDFVSNSAVS